MNISNMGMRIASSYIYDNVFMMVHCSCSDSLSFRHPVTLHVTLKSMIDMQPPRAVPIQRMATTTIPGMIGYGLYALPMDLSSIDMLRAFDMLFLFLRRCESWDTEIQRSAYNWVRDFPHPRVGGC